MEPGRCGFWVIPWSGLVRHSGDRERVSRGFNLADVFPPSAFVKGILIRAALPVNEFPDDVRVASVLGGFNNHPDE
jgi:hypothetical protein